MKKRILVVEKVYKDIPFRSFPHILMEEGYTVKGERSEVGIFEQISSFKPGCYYSLLDIIKPSLRELNSAGPLKPKIPPNTYW